jgi:uncharacterized repeat protein (TIGR01451 family)
MRRVTTFNRGRGGIVLLGVVAVLALEPLSGGPAAGAAVGPPFSCRSELDFLSQGSPETQLFQSVAGGGSVTYTPLGPPQQATYNALGYDPLNSYLYATNILLASSLGEPGTLYKIDNTGQATPLGPISGYPVAFRAPADGAFDGSGNYWITNGNGSTVAYQIDVEGSPQVVGEVPLSQPWQPIDFTFYEGFMWGLAGKTVYRLELATGVVSTFPAPGGIVPGGLGFGAAWTTASGDLGFSDNETGQVYKIAITNPSGTPTFKVVAEYSGPVAGTSNDGAACIPTEPVDLAITKTGPAVVAPGSEVSWALTATNNGPGNSSGFSISDQVPSGYTNPTTSTQGCAVKGNEVLCSEGSLARGASFSVTITATAPTSTGTCLTNTALVTGNERDPETANNASSVQTCVGCSSTSPKVNVRWHYSANGTSGSWSGTREAKCGQTITLGPQAMEGDLRVDPGVPVKAGYDFTLPGNSKPFTVSFTKGQVVFAVRCASGKAPSEPTFAVTLEDKSYTVTNSNWYPSGNQSSPLVYQGTVAAPNLCGGGQLRLDKGGTFSAFMTLH